MVLTCSRRPGKENSALAMDMRPDSMRDMSRMSLMRPSRWRAEEPMRSRCWRVLAEMSGSLRAMLSSPMMAFMGVRISWLMLERKTVLARLASSAAARAWLCSRERLVSASTSEMLMHIFS